MDSRGFLKLGYKIIQVPFWYWNHHGFPVSQQAPASPGPWPPLAASPFPPARNLKNWKTIKVYWVYEFTWHQNFGNLRNAESVTNETRWNHGARETQRRNAFSSLRTLTPSVNAAAAGVLEFWESHLIINGANCSSANLADFLDQNDQSQPDCRSGFIVTCDHMCCPLQKLSQVGAKLGPRLRSFQQELCHQILQNGIHLLLDILLMLLSHCRGALPRLNLPRRTAWQHRQSWCHAKMTRRCFFDQKWWSENHGCAEITFRVGFKKKVSLCCKRSGCKSAGRSAWKKITSWTRAAGCARCRQSMLDVWTELWRSFAPPRMAGIYLLTGTVVKSHCGQQHGW